VVPAAGAAGTAPAGASASGTANLEDAGSAASGGTGGAASDTDGGALAGAGTSASGTSGEGGSSSIGDAGGASFGGGPAACGAGLPQPSSVLATLHLTNQYLLRAWPDPSVDIVIDRARPSNLWTRSVYFEGLMALYAIEPDAALKAGYYDYAVRWGASPSHPWQLTYGGTSTRSADNQCCGQTYLDLAQIEPDPVRSHDIKADLDKMVASSSSGDWTWVDAIQMAMPVFAKLGVVTKSSGYFEKMHALYVNAKSVQGFYDTANHLWWRDARFKPPFTTPNGKPCYWSRGNGWVFAALTRVLDITPSSEAHRAEYVADFTAMAGALQKIQRADGFWNVSLGDPDDHGGPELTGTALFAYGLAWGIRVGLLEANEYGPTVSRAWCAMASAVHENGALGYAQGTGSKPADHQPVTFDSVPDDIGFPLGCFLLGGTEVWRLAAR
jgi:rhamnogalacturonyl hydrolase YesR